MSRPDCPLLCLTTREGECGWKDSDDRPLEGQDDSVAETAETQGEGILNLPNDARHSHSRSHERREERGADGRQLMDQCTRHMNSRYEERTWRLTAQL